MYQPTDHKIQIREFVKNFLKNCKSVLTLPNLYFDLEEFLAKTAKVVCFEQNRVVFKQQQLVAPLNIELNCGNVLNAESSLYDGMFLDFCGPFPFKLLNFLRNVKPNSKLVLTFLAARESRTIQKFIDISNRPQSYALLFKHLGFRTISYVEYQSGSPMIVFFIIKL